MGLNARENINGQTPQDLNKLNNNFMTIWKTLFGGLDFSDTNDKLKKKIQTQQLPVQGEGNFDGNFPLYVRFFVPSNTKSITSTSFNMICERYRMDSGIAMGGGSVVDAPIQMSLASASTGVASVSSTATYGASTTPVYSWYKLFSNGDKIGYTPPIYDFFNTQTGTPSTSMYNNYVVGSNAIDSTKLIGVRTNEIDTTFGRVPVLDLSYLNHEHEVNITAQPHSHTVTMQPHTHDASAKITLPEHIHNLNEGIKISNQDAVGVVVKLNGNVISNMDSTANNTKNNIDAKDHIKIGEWNVLECTTSNLARITIYGIIELVMNY